MGAVASYLLFLLLICGPAVLVLAAWLAWGRIKSDAAPLWRRMSMGTALLAVSAAWLLLAALELPMPYLRQVWGPSFVASFWRHSFPIGLGLSIVAIPFGLLGRGRVRILSICAAAGLACWWY